MPITPFAVDPHKFNTNLFHNINEVKTVLKVNMVPVDVIRSYIREVYNDEDNFLQITSRYVAFTAPVFEGTK